MLEKMQYGFIEELYVKPLKPGNVVVIDTDFLYREGDSEIHWTISGERYERRWKREKMLEQMEKTKKQNTSNKGRGEKDEK